MPLFSILFEMGRLACLVLSHETVALVTVQTQKCWCVSMALSSGLLSLQGIPEVSMSSVMDARSPQLRNPAPCGVEVT